MKLYAKLPDWFTIPTPLGTYNPDLVVLIEVDGEKKLHFVLETKCNILTETFRPTEKAKIDCGHNHFEALGNSVVFEETADFNTFIVKKTDQSRVLVLN